MRKLFKIPLILILATVLMLSVSSCQSSGTPPISVTTAFPPGPGTQDTISVPGFMQPPGHTPGGNVYSVQLKLVPSKLEYPPGEPVHMNVTLTNASSGKVDPITVQPYPPVIYIVTVGATPESTRLIKTFPIGNDPKTLALGEQVTYSLLWDQKDDTGKQVSPGWYFYEFKFNMIGTGLGKTGTGGRSRAFLIQHPQGELQKTIDLNLTQTIKDFPFSTMDGKKQSIDLAVTLQQVIMNDQGLSFLALANSTHNPVSSYKSPEWMIGFAQAQAIVDGEIRDAGVANIRPSDSGLELRWGGNDSYLNPLPADAQQLTLVITRFLDWQGRLEFPVPLR
jgi:hypothetical protein